MARKRGNGKGVCLCVCVKDGGFFSFSDANERRNGFLALSLQSVSPLLHAPLLGHCGSTKLQAQDPIT